MAGLVFLLVFWALAGACQRHGVGGFLLFNSSSIISFSVNRRTVASAVRSRFATNRHGMKPRFYGFCKPFPSKGGHAGKAPLGVSVKLTRPGQTRVWRKLHRPEATHKKSTGGAFAQRSLSRYRRVAERGLHRFIGTTTNQPHLCSGNRANSI